MSASTQPGPPVEILIVDDSPTQAQVPDQQGRHFTHAAKEIGDAGNRAKSDFLANMGHELRTPLGAIIGFSELLDDRIFGDLNPKQGEYVKNILGSGRRLLSLINNTLDRARIEAGKMELELNPLPIATLPDNSPAMVIEKRLPTDIAETPEPTVPAVGGAGRILVADDEETNRSLLRDILEANGHRVTLAEDGLQALEKALAEPPDVAVLDVMMPKMDGYEVCNQLRKDSRTAHLPILMVTALKDRADRLKGIQAGANDFLTKPIDAEEIRLRVKNAVIVKHLYDKARDDFARLKELETLRDNLTHMIVHDMRSPLMAIMLGLEVHTRQAAAKLTEAEMEPVMQAASSVDRLVEMVSSLLDVSRMESGEMPIHIEDCDLTGLTCEVMKSLKNLRPACRVEVTQRNPVMARCDRELMRRVFTNIGANAMKFVPEDGRVNFDIQKDDAGIRVLINDNGPGIPKEYHAKIFEKFGQVEARRQGKMYSTGLGLTFCKLAVEAHGGMIGVESEVDKGSTFWFTLPA